MKKIWKHIFWEDIVFFLLKNYAYSKVGAVYSATIIKFALVHVFFYIHDAMKHPQYDHKLDLSFTNNILDIEQGLRVIIG